MSRPIPIQSLQRADRFLGRVACTLLQPWRWARRLRRTQDGQGVNRILLIKFWGIGSLQLLTPAVGTLRRRHQDATFVLLTLSDNETFVRGLGVFDEVVSLNVHSTSWFGITRRILALIGRLRSQRFDRVYDFEFFTRFSAVISFAVGAPRSLGFSSTSAWRGGLHTDDVTFNRYWHVSRNFRALAGGENGAEVTSDQLAPFVVTPADALSLDRKLARVGVDAEREIVILNPNAGQLSLERRWPRNNFATLAQRIHSASSASVVLIGSNSEREYTAGVRNAARDGDLERLVDLSGELSMGELCALLSRARALITNDSGPMHLAAALGIPTLGLFGPETPLMYAPLGPRADSLYIPPVCSPCINVHQGKVASCIHERPECLENITVDDVWSWLEEESGWASSPLKIASRSLKILDA